ncbi:MAG: hypothetical protein HFH12_03945 [Dorea sp.]|nr:hypothetical protein [Dorea sp.]
MFKNKKISEMQKQGAQTIRFDPDSSPAAWVHYQQFYSHNKYLNTHYDFQKQFFYNYYNKVDLKTGYFDGLDWFNYVNKSLQSSSGYNRLFVLQTGTKTKNSENNEFIVAANRLGGDCDFNFNEKKYLLFSKIIKSDPISSPQEKNNAIQQLSRCRDMHHTLLNFSLMQAIGNMQKFKGNNRYDRLDTFIYELDKFYRGISNAILQFSSPNNKPALSSFLNAFKDIYEYCATFYFITEKSFIDEIIKQGSMPITNVNELMRYMNLAEKYWAKKEFEFLKNEFLAVGDYFKKSLNF